MNKLSLVYLKYCPLRREIIHFITILVVNHQEIYLLYMSKIYQNEN
jgi:hypothetical protein